MAHTACYRLDRLGLTEREALIDYGPAPLGAADTLASSGSFSATFQGLGVRHRSDSFISEEPPLRLATGRIITDSHRNIVMMSPSTKWVYFLGSGCGEAQRLVFKQCPRTGRRVHHLPKSTIESTAQKTYYITCTEQSCHILHVCGET